MNVNEYSVELKPLGMDRPRQTVTVSSATHMSAVKALEMEYPEMRVVRVTREWLPIDNCEKCGSPIFKGDYHNDVIRKRNGKKYCLDCVAKQ